MNKGVSLLGGIGLGAGLMYLLDPERGNRRRALLRDKATRAWHVSGASLSRAADDIGNRSRGLVAEIRGRMTEEEAPDRVLVERVRAKLGRVVSHPRAIEVTAVAGKVILTGLALAREEERLLNAVTAVRGVREVESRLEVRETAGDEPALQGGMPREEAIDILQRHWAPATRLLAGSAGSALAAVGASRRDLPGALLGAAGAALLARAATNMELKRLVGTAGGRRGVEVHKTLQIAAPVDEVFRFWAQYENFPRWMSHVRSVTATGDDRSHWVVDGPAGVPVAFDAVLTEFVPNELISWKSAPGAAIRNAGLVHFAPADGGTRVDLYFTYNPPTGAVGHAVAGFFGADPKRLMDDDLARLKTMIETGTPPRDAAAPERTGIAADLQGRSSP